MSKNFKIMDVKTAIQRIESSFHDLAVKKFFPNTGITLVPCNSFKNVISALENSRVDIGVITIENTIAGSLLSNY